MAASFKEGQRVRLKKGITRSEFSNIGLHRHEDNYKRSLVVVEADNSDYIDCSGWRMGPFWFLKSMFEHCVWCNNTEEISGKGCPRCSEKVSE